MEKLLIVVLCLCFNLCCSDDDSPTSFLDEEPIIGHVFSPSKITIYFIDKVPLVVNFTHDEHGRILCERSDNKYQILRTYDSTGNKLTELTQGWRNSLWVDSISHTYRYSPNGKLLTSSTDYLHNGRNATLTYSYNNSDYPTSYLYESFSADTLRYSIREKQSRSSNGKLLTNATESLRDGIWVNDHIVTYSYDAKWNCTGYVSQNWVDGTLVNGTKYLMSFDKYDSLSQTQTEYWINNIWVIVSKSHNYFDSKGNYVLFTMVSGRDGVFTDSTHCEYMYDASGNCISEIREKFSGDTLSSSSKETSSFDPFGNAISIEEQSFTGGTWQYGKSTLVLRYHDGTYVSSGCYRMEAQYYMYQK